MQNLFLSARQVREVVEELEGVRLPQRTLANWLTMGLVAPSVRWDRARGRNHPCLFNLSDLARVRLIVRLRKITGLTASAVRLVLSYIDADLREAFRPKSKAKIVIVDKRVYVVLPGMSMPVEATAPGQHVMFSVSELLAGNEETAKRVGAARVA